MNELTEQQVTEQLADIGILTDKWQNRNDQYYQDRIRSQGPSALIAAGCLCGVALIAYICFVNWAVKVVTR